MTKGAHTLGKGIHILFLAAAVAVATHFLPQINTAVMIGTVGLIETVKGFMLKRKEENWER